MLQNAVDVRRAAEAALGQPVRTASVISRTPISYDPYLPGRHVDRVVGVADTDSGARTEWQAIAKRTEGPGLRAARRELNAYRMEITTGAGAGGFRGPRLDGWEEGAEHVELWLEPLHDEHGGAWDVERFGVAARHIGAWVAATAERHIPDDFDSEDAWAERHGQPTRLEEATARLDDLKSAPNAGELADLLADGFRRTQALIDSTPERIASLAAFPQTLLHHDLVRSNLFALSRYETAAIDWENVGRGPFGVELAPLVIGSVRRGEASADDLGAIEDAVLSAYVDALLEHGHDNEADVRAAYRLTIGLRWHVVLGAIGSWLDPTSWGMRGSRRDEPRDEALRHLVRLSRHILDAGLD